MITSALGATTASDLATTHYTQYDNTLMTLSSQNYKLSILASTITLLIVIHKLGLNGKFQKINNVCDI